MRRKPHYGRRPCPNCGEMVTKNAAGRAAHMRWCKGPRPAPAKVEPK